MSKKTESVHFAEFCWYKGKCWFNPKNPLNNRGEISLWSVKNVPEIMTGPACWTSQWNIELEAI